MLSIPAALQEAHRLLDKGLLVEAEKSYLAILSRDPGNPEALTHLGNVAFGRGDVDLALRYYEAALRQDPFYAHALWDKGVALLHFKLGEVERGLNLDGSREIKETLAEMRKIVEAAYEDVRQAIFGLRTMVSRGLGLVPTLTEYLHDFSELRKIPVELRIGHAETIRFSPRLEIQLIRIIHEALTNVSKHAEATRGTVRFEREGKFAKVTIEDNGKGFVLEEVMGKGLRFGLQTMRERAEGVGGRFNIETLPHGGTRVIVHLPLGKGSYEAHSSAPGR